VDDVLGDHVVVLDERYFSPPRTPRRQGRQEETKAFALLGALCVLGVFGGQEAARTVS
jgi:hypothetical protein